MSTPTTNSENTTMPPPPPRPAMVQQRRTSEPASSIVIPRMAAPATAVETSLDGEGNMTCASPATSINHDRHPLKRRATISSSHHPLAEHGLPPRPPPAKRTRMALETTDKENTVNYANDEDEDEEELVYNGPLEDPEQASGDDDKTEQDSVITAEIDSMMQMGLQAFQDRERLQQENNFLKDDNAAKALEISRLRTALKQKQEIIANLLQASETAKADARQSSRSTVTEATLRLELASATEQKNQALAQAATSQRKASRLEDEKHQIKVKLQRVTQEKFKLDRERQAQQHLAKNLDQQSASDTAFYKRKVTELTAQVQSLNAAIMEKDRSMEDMRRQLERSLSRAEAAKRQAKSSVCKNNRHT